MKELRPFICFLMLIALATVYIETVAQPSPTKRPLRLAVAGTSHGHVSWILNRKKDNDILLVGIYEADTQLVAKHIRRYGLSRELFFTDLKKMLDAVKPEAVVAFGSIFDHLAVVEHCAPRKIHVMVEKPLAVSVDHALKMEKLATTNGIHLLTNYETSWYPSTEKTFQLLNDSGSVGQLRKAVFHHGHQGPKEIGVAKEFLDWLTDPVQNGGGAIIDFGCYGANIMTYLLKGIEPVSVSAVTRQFKPWIYSKVDDEATIIVTYPSSQAIIQASWNWPFGRKDMEIYGETGYVLAQNSQKLLVRRKDDKEEVPVQVNASDLGVYQDPFKYFADVINKIVIVQNHSLYALPNNLTVVKILEAAKESARSGKTVMLKK